MARMKRKRASAASARRSKTVKNVRSGPTLPESPLLSLPAELRNRIYEYVLKQQDRINITPEYRFPPLLQTSRQIRHETYPIFLELNTFSIEIRDLDAKLSHAWAAAVARLKAGGTVKKRTGVGFLIAPSHSWNNLLKWCEHIRTGEPGYTMSRPVHPDPLNTVISAAHKIAVAGRSHGLSWDECKERLDDLYSVISAYDPRWKKEDEEG